MKSSPSYSKIALVNLRAQYSTIKHEIDEAIANIVSSSQFIQGNEVLKFEESFASFCSSSIQAYCASCANGTDALELALAAFDVGQDDEIITVSHSFFATVEAVVNQRATPVLIDINPKTMLMDESKIEEKITSKTKGIIAVQLYGQTCNMEEINRIAKKHNLFVIEDAAQAHGASWNGQRVGTLGDLACFSFFPGKNFGCYGDGGAVVGRDADLIKKVKQISCHGREKGEKYVHSSFGRNSRLDSLQAAILNVKLKYLDQWTQQRREIANYYLEHLKDLPIILPYIDPQSESAWHLFVIRTPESSMRETLFNDLKSKGIGVGLHYPIPIHKQPAFLNLYSQPQLSLPHTESTAQSLISLPMYPELEKKQLEFIVGQLHECCKAYQQEI
ncbi:MAG: dTDP-3-amino-3,6-dideoxy-alpha-D-galactopyranose transaminase [Chlamydiae bacterium]|nr:dTDP-3-amino-3,6-dideoxy-alpha-D-galactopyranose transaminase [Chlamydiota bacterium]